MAEGECGQVDPEKPEAGGPTPGENGVGELRVRGQCGDLQEHTEGQIGHVDVGERPDLAAMTDDKRQCDVEGE